MGEAFALQRFVDAQDADGTYDRAIRELRQARKGGHWMWFVFPQLAGLGRTVTAQHFGLSGLQEARAYLGHPVLGRRLVECAAVLTELGATDPVLIFGPLDAMKLRSSMTLFAQAAPDPQVFRAVLDRFFAGVADESTIQRF